MCPLWKQGLPILRSRSDKVRQETTTCTLPCHILQWYNCAAYNLLRCCVAVVRQLRGGGEGGAARPGEIPALLQRLALGHQSWHGPGPGRGSTAGQHSYNAMASPELCTIRSNEASITMNSRIICIYTGQLSLDWRCLGDRLPRTASEHPTPGKTAQHHMVFLSMIWCFRTSWCTGRCRETSCCCTRRCRTLPPFSPTSSRAPWTGAGPSAWGCTSEPSRSH